MNSFYKMSDKLTLSPPKKYELGSYMDSFHKGRLGHDLEPVNLDDLAVTSRDDFNDWYAKHGKDTSSLGKPMSDEEFQRFHGMG